MEYDNQYELYHFGVKGMKWGIRKAKKIVVNSARFIKKSTRRVSKVANEQLVARSNRTNRTNRTNKINPTTDRKAKAKKVIKVGAVVAGTVLAVYGAKKLDDALRDFNYEQGRKAIERIQRAHDLSYQRYWLSQQR